MRDMLKYNLIVEQSSRNCILPYYLDPLHSVDGKLFINYGDAREEKKELVSNLQFLIVIIRHKIISAVYKTSLNGRNKLH